MFFLFCFLLTLFSCTSAPEPVLPEPVPPESVLSESVPQDTVEAVTNRDNLGEEEEKEEEFFTYGEIPENAENLPILNFTEVWGYLIAGREQALKLNYPLSDLVYFGAEIDTYGKLTDVPNRRKLGRFPGRVHLVAACNSRSLAHFILEPESAVHRQLVEDLLEAAGPYDGLQIDFELIPARDGDRFLSFLQELRNGLGDKLFTIALPARRKTLSDDVFDYQKIKPLVDRIFVMAYDEHWSTSEPGSIASLGWCRSVAEYALKTVGPEKLVMGLPFYGRTWGSFNPFRAYFHSGIERIRSENAITEVVRENGIPTFSYETTVKVTVYYEDIYSLSFRGGMYRDMGVKAIGFWSLGQEDSTIWNFLKITEKDADSNS
ncbi:glycosyl hydrolase family 18 protein [Treponema primitia]|uniref:glycosyl hydrolase family 18 protein n=1 Tax=Treponema primitia TaxID=88058 RepID=UPI00397FEACD